MGVWVFHVCWTLAHTLHFVVFWYRVCTTSTTARERWVDQFEDNSIWISNTSIVHQNAKNEAITYQKSPITGPMSDRLKCHIIDDSVKSTIINPKLLISLQIMNIKKNYRIAYFAQCLAWIISFMFGLSAFIRPNHVPIETCSLIDGTVNTSIIIFNSSG